jgi:ribosome-associated heat shock protein Hsp15
MGDTARVDRWLWAIRLYRTRSDATDGCKAGHVRVNGRPAKAATALKVGDRVDARVHGVDRTVEVAAVIEKRVGAAVAAGCYVDHTPPPPEAEEPVASRERGSGRPTKRERRQLERWRHG